jgi:hypothetical protein
VGGGFAKAGREVAGREESSFFEKKEAKKLLSVWLRFGGRLGSLRPEGVFGAKSVKQ